MDSRRNTYWPPALGYIAAISPYARAPSSVMTPESSQASMSHIGDGTPRAMLAETIKMPDPIIDPATSIVASVNDIALTNSVLDCGVEPDGTAELLMAGAAKSGSRAPDKRRGANFRGNSAKSRGPQGQWLGRAAAVVPATATDWSRARRVRPRSPRSVAPSSVVGCRPDACQA